MTRYLYTAAQTRELDRIAIEESGVPGYELMKRAGRAAFDELVNRWPRAGCLSVCCGRGNNAGDGYVIAGLAAQSGIEVELLQLGDPARLSGDAATARRWAEDQGVRPKISEDGAVDFSGLVIVDALLGTGIDGPLRGPFAEMVRRINSAGLPVLAVDIPSGVSADSGAVTDNCVRADVTVTFIGDKIGLHTGQGKASAGEVVFAELGVDDQVRYRVNGVPLLVWGDLDPSYQLTPPAPDAYKQALGHIVIAGGDHSMGGAVAMAAEAALRTGAGMVTVITRAEHRPAILSRRPEVMVVDAEDDMLRDEVFGKASVLVLGPGLGRKSWGSALAEQVVSLGKPTVVDADGLHQMDTLKLPWPDAAVITPHAAEAAQLLGLSVADVQSDRVGAVCALTNDTGAVAVLKGPGSLVAAGNPPRLLGVCGHGNPGMATAGMGDVLAGMIGGLIGQGLSTQHAAVFGTCLHSAAADAAAEQTGQRSLLATDLMASIMSMLK